MTEHILAAYAADLAVRKVGKTAAQLSRYRANAHEILPGLAYEDGVVRVRAFQVDHGRWKHAYGYRFDAQDRSIVISGDTRPADSVAKSASTKTGKGRNDGIGYRVMCVHSASP